MELIQPSLRDLGNPKSRSPTLKVGLFSFVPPGQRFALVWRVFYGIKSWRHWPKMSVRRAFDFWACIRAYCVQWNGPKRR